MDSYNLTEKTFLQYALKNYSNPSCQTLNEFEQDLKIIKYLKRLLTQYTTRNMLNENLLLNHIITLFNLFGIESTPKILYYSIPKRHWSQITTILYILNRLPEKVYGIEGCIIITKDIKLDLYLLNKLNEIY